VTRSSQDSQEPLVRHGVQATIRDRVIQMRNGLIVGEEPVVTEAVA
jgi:hypothetical protein